MKKNTVIQIEFTIAMTKREYLRAKATTLSERTNKKGDIAMGNCTRKEPGRVKIEI